MEKDQPKVVIQLSNDSSEIQKATIAQISNLLAELPRATIELIIHSHGINLVFKNSHWQHKLEALVQRDVHFMVCKKTMDSMQLEKEDLLPFVEIIPSAVARLVMQQQNGWSYLKAG